MKDKDQYQTLILGGKLVKRTQWFSADRTKRFARDDKSSIEYIQPSVGPGDYNSGSDFSKFEFKIKRFSEMPRNELSRLLKAIDCDPGDLSEGVRKPVTQLTNTSPPTRAILEQTKKHKTVASIPHKNKAVPYLEDEDGGRPEEPAKAVKENRYQQRPPVLQQINPDVSPSSYHPRVEPTKPAASTRCSDFFGRSVVDRTIKWEEELSRQDPNVDAKMRILNKRSQIAPSGPFGTLRATESLLAGTLQDSLQTGRALFDRHKEVVSTSHTRKDSEAVVHTPLGMSRVKDDPDGAHLIVPGTNQSKKEGPAGSSAAPGGSPSTNPANTSLGKNSPELPSAVEPTSKGAKKSLPSLLQGEALGSVASPKKLDTQELESSNHLARTFGSKKHTKDFAKRQLSQKSDAERSEREGRSSRLVANDYGEVNNYMQARYLELSQNMLDNQQKKQLQKQLKTLTNLSYQIPRLGSGDLTADGTAHSASRAKLQTLKEQLA